MINEFPILIAEDNLVSRKRLELLLRKEGYEVASAENGKRAFELFRSSFFPIVITDWMMPEMDGPELCRAIRGAHTRGYVFIILLTAKESKDDIVSGLESGADDYLKKPFDDAELKARLKTGIRILKLEQSLKQAAEKVRRLSITDPLTGCYNRGYLNQHLERELKRAKRYQKPLSVVLCDIDHFKEINDTYGHQAGDKVLKKFVKFISGSIRHDLDWIVRYGGEEFIIVLPETDLSGASIVAQRLCSKLPQITMAVQHKKLHITASFGATGFTSLNYKSISPKTIISAADRFLYDSKKGGRNRVTSGPL
jgi:two-component system cell cycle response regulator